MAHVLPNHCPGRCSICDLAKYTVSLFGRNCCLLYTISVVCHINLTNGWMTVLLPCQIDTRQGLQVLYVIVGQKPLVCWRKLNNTKRVARNRIFMPPDRMIGGILFLSCLFVCLFVCLSVVNFNIRYNF